MPATRERSKRTGPRNRTRRGLSSVKHTASERPGVTMIVVAAAATSFAAIRGVRRHKKGKHRS